ncbi:hypothetical protein, partial [Phaeobacter italicus]|uniref:hypothetical protein n=1 Tax=Phaeobacter italicus TaxID=481446 RepID=UPI002FDD6E36
AAFAHFIRHSVPSFSTLPDKARVPILRDVSPACLSQPINVAIRDQRTTYFPAEHNKKGAEHAYSICLCVLWGA